MRLQCGFCCAEGPGLARAICPSPVRRVQEAVAFSVRLAKPKANDTTRSDPKSGLLCVLGLPTRQKRRAGDPSTASGRASVPNRKGTNPHRTPTGSGACLSQPSRAGLPRPRRGKATKLHFAGRCAAARASHGAATSGPSRERCGCAFCWRGACAGHCCCCWRACHAGRCGCSGRCNPTQPKRCGARGRPESPVSSLPQQVQQCAPRLFDTRTRQNRGFQHHRSLHGSFRKLQKGVRVNHGSN